MTYIKTTLKREIAIDSIITIHYFEYMKDFVFHGESHDFWEFLYVDQGSVIVQAGENHFRMEAGDIIFHEPMNFMPYVPSEILRPTLCYVLYNKLSCHEFLSEEKFHP